jgi:hypothetical protein
MDTSDLDSSETANSIEADAENPSGLVLTAIVSGAGALEDMSVEESGGYSGTLWTQSTAESCFSDSKFDVVGDCRIRLASRIHPLDRRSPTRSSQARLEPEVTHPWTYSRQSCLQCNRK